MNALSRVALLVLLGLAELEVAVPVVDGLEVEEVGDAVGVEVVAPEAEDEAEDASLMLIVNPESPVYDCTVLPPDVVVVRSSLEIV